MNRQARFFYVMPPSERDYEGRGVVYYDTPEPPEFGLFTAMQGWHDVRAELRGGDYADWLASDGPGPLLSEAVVDLLATRASEEDVVEWLSVEVRHGSGTRVFAVPHFPQDISPLNEAATKWIVTGKRRYPRVPIIRAELCGVHNLFALSNEGYFFVVADELKRELARTFRKTFSFAPIDVA